MRRSCLLLAELVFLSLCSAAGAAAQERTISGHVVDAATAEPLPGVNIFVANTTLGAASHSDGTFLVTGVPDGLVEVVASMVGYEPQSRMINVSGGVTPDVEFRLVERVFHQGEAVVTAKRPKNWRQHLERFTRELLGTSENAEDCSILNPYVLDFLEDPDLGTLRAFASEPLLIENLALGYDIMFVLDDFQVSDAPYSIRYRGRPRFKERSPASRAQAERFRSQRRAAYLGSQRHFLIALLTSSLEEEGFDARVASKRVTDPLDIDLLPPLDVGKATTRGQMFYEMQVFVPGVLHVVYHGEQEPPRYRRFVRDVTGRSHVPRRAQTSYLTFDHGVTIHSTGYAYDPYAITTVGYWAWERLADALPRNYGPQ